jgi:NAD(P)-dependent dehydrogenase (short-subunit alcohol dehydrogenase family)
MQIEGRVFLVTGASMGIGLATARAFTARGGKVALLARSAEILSDLEKELPESLAVPADMVDHQSIRAAVQKTLDHYGRLDGLVNNAGRSYEARIEEIEPAVFEEIFRLNVLGPIVAMQAAIPAMRAQGEGSIVSVNSGTAFMVIPGYSVYSSSKRALLGFTQTARQELAADGIVVSEVYPFITATNFGLNRMGKSDSGPRADYRQGDTPEFVADLILRAIEEGEAEYFANDRIKALAGR